jgi:hypothetical protein
MATSQELEPWFQIDNNGTSSVSMESLAVRYYFTADGDTSLASDCFYAQVGFANVLLTFYPTIGTDADHYIEVTFTAGAGVIQPGTNSGVVQLNIHDTAYAVTFNQANDWSFDPTKTSFTPWTHMTIYQSGQLVWGTPP